MAGAILTLLSALPATAQQTVPDVPRLLSYQGVLVEPDGVKVPDATYVVTIKLYDVPAGGMSVWEETQSVVTLDGVFDAILGLRVPLDTVPFDRQYWLAVQLQGEQEMTPRTMVVSAPYALRAYRASIADSLVGGVVRSVNGLQGHLTLRGAAGTTVTEVGDTIVISSSGGTGSDPDLNYGAIWYGDPTNKPTERAIGRPHDVLTVNNAGTEPVWSNELILHSVEVDSLHVEGHAQITGTVVVDNQANFNGPVRFELLPDFPLEEGAIIRGGADGRAEVYPSSNEPGTVLMQDADGNPVWAKLGFASGRVATIGQIRQVVPEVAVQATSKIMIYYEDPNGGEFIPIQVVAQTPGTGFTIQFAALPPVNTFVIYTVMP